MRMTIESTSRLVRLNDPIGYGSVEARVWEGQTDSGVPVVVLVTRIAVPKDAPAQAHHQFMSELRETRAPSTAGVEAFPTRMVL